FALFYAKEFRKLIGQRLRANSYAGAAKERKLTRVHERKITEVARHVSHLFLPLPLRFSEIFLRLLERLFHLLHRFFIRPHELSVFERAEHSVALSRALSQCCRQRLPRSAAHHFDLDCAVSWRFAKQSLRFADAVHATAVKRHNYIVLFQTSLFSGTPRDDLHHH